MKNTSKAEKIIFGGVAEREAATRLLNDMRQLGWSVELDFQKGKHFSAIAEVRKEETKEFVTLISYPRRPFAQDVIVYSVYDMSTGQELRASTYIEETKADRQAQLRTPTESQDATLNINT